MTKILLIKPPVYDFAAYDLWAKPLGLLYLSSLLKKQSVDIQLFDYMDRCSVLEKSPQSNQYGCGHYIKDTKRKYYRFGISGNTAEQYFKQIDTPDIIIITSNMTYWHIGIEEAISVLKQLFQKIPIALGVFYATLCSNHAKILII
jgi:hypothetical protein